MELNEDLWKTSQKDVKTKKWVKREWLHCKSVNPMYKANNEEPKRRNSPGGFSGLLTFVFFFFFFQYSRARRSNHIFCKGIIRGGPSLFVRRFCKSSVLRHSRKFSHAAITSHEPIPFRRLNQIGRPKLIWVGAPKLEFDSAHVMYDAGV